VAAGWWTLLIAYLILLIQMVCYIVIMARHPAGVLCIWGEGVNMVRDAHRLAMAMVHISSLSARCCSCYLAHALGETSGKEISFGIPRLPNNVSVPRRAQATKSPPFRKAGRMILRIA